MVHKRALLALPMAHCQWPGTPLGECPPIPTRSMTGPRSGAPATFGAVTCLQARLAGSGLILTFETSGG
jgi:hypothetical protein